MITDMERIGDQTSDISEIIGNHIKQTSEQKTEEIAQRPDFRETLEEEQKELAENHK